MKALQILTYIIFTGSIISFTSCSDDSGDVPLDSFIGQWNVVESEAVAYIDGYKIEGFQISTTGTISYFENGEGKAAFTMSFEGESSRVDESFTWVDRGFELVWNEGDRESEIRWTIDVDEPNMKIMTFTHELDEDSTDELEVTATLERL